MLQILKKIFYYAGDLILLNNIMLRENNKFREHKHYINRKIINLIIANTIVYSLIALSYFLIENKADIYFIFLNSAVILYGVHFLMLIASLASYRNMDCLRHPCNRAECSIGTANYFKKIISMSKVSYGINVASIILLFVVVVL